MFLNIRVPIALGRITGRAHDGKTLTESLCQIIMSSSIQHSNSSIAHRLRLVKKNFEISLRGRFTTVNAGLSRLLALAPVATL